MAKKKSDQIKTYVLLGLTVLLVVALYVRFVHKRTPQAAGQDQPEPTAAELDIPEVDFDRLQASHRFGRAVRDALREPVRDIFVRGGLFGTAEDRLSETGKSLSVASLTLKGVVSGGDKPVALINDQFVRIGDSIDGYQVVRIEKKEVFLDSGIETFRLEIQKND